MVHCSGVLKKSPTVIGNRVIVGAGSIIHGCKLEDECYISDGAQVLDGATVGKNSIVGPGSIVLEGKKIPSGQYWSGIPASYQRDITKEELDQLTKSVLENVNLSHQHAKESIKSVDDIEWEGFVHGEKLTSDPNFPYFVTKELQSKREYEVEHHTVPGRLFNSPISARGDKEAV